MKKLLLFIIPLLLASCAASKPRAVRAVCYGPNAKVTRLNANTVRVVVPQTGIFAVVKYRRMFDHGADVCFEVMK